MEKLSIIDANFHIEEPVDMWDYLETTFQRRRPFPVTVEKNIGHTNLNAFWYIDGAVVPKLVGPKCVLAALLQVFLAPRVSPVHTK